MGIKPNLVLVLFAVIPFARPVQVPDLVVHPDKENVVASRLEGSWRRQAELTAQLRGGVPMPSEDPIGFRADPSALKHFPEGVSRFLEGKALPMAGVMTRDGSEHAFLLTEVHGNPYVVYTRPKGDDPHGDTESFNVMLAWGRDPVHDLLFIGGDFNNEPFTAYERVASIEREVPPEPEHAVGLRITATPVDEVDPAVDPSRQVFGFQEWDEDLLVTGWVTSTVGNDSGERFRFVTWNVVTGHRGTPRPASSGFKVVHMDPARTLGGEAIFLSRVTIRPRDGLHWGDVASRKDLLVVIEPAK